MSQTKPYPLPIAGIDVLSNETALIPGAVRSAVNVDIGRAGQVKRRVGYTRRVAVSGLHSAFYAAQKGWILVAKDSVLYKLDPVTYDLTALFTLHSPDRLEYVEYNGNVYFSNKTTLGWIPSDAVTARAVGVPTPQPPILSPALGALLPGQYGVIITFVDDRGEESGSCDFQAINLPTGGGIRLDNLQQKIGWTIRAYITSADGDILRLSVEFPAVFPSYVLTDNALGAECTTQALEPLIPGDMVRWHNGRLLTAKNGALSFSGAFRPHLYNPAHDVIPFSGYISFIEAVAGGVYVGDSRGVWFLSGNDPVKFEQRRVSLSRAVMRSSVLVPAEYLPQKQVTADGLVAVWLSSVGYVAGMPDGTTVELHPERIRVPAGLVGRSALLLREGRKQLVTPVNSTTTAAFGNAVDSII